MEERQESAFPNFMEIIDPVDGTTKDIKITDGMSKRFYAACAAMQGIIASQSGEYDPTGKCDLLYVRDLISQSYQFADELLKQE